MIIKLFNIDIDTLYVQHIQNIKNNFFKLFNFDYKILICSYDACISDEDISFFAYFCHVTDIDNTFIILDCKNKTITLAYNKKILTQQTNIAFHGNTLNKIENLHKYYDNIIDDFNIDEQKEEYKIIQELNNKYNNCNLKYDKQAFLTCSFLRMYKSDYEIVCIMKANIIALNGHYEVEKMFNNDNEHCNEIDLYYSFLSNTKIVVGNLSYPPIVALNNFGSILHYPAPLDFSQQKHNLLIDAGIKYRNYASDITKTYSKDPLWSTLIYKMKIIQKRIIENIQLDHNFYDLHVYSRRLIIDFLIDNNIVINSTQQDNFANYIFKNNLDKMFYSHGLGHLLGLDVHDVGNNLSCKDNQVVLNDDSATSIRANFKIKNNVVFTIEPGFYLNLDYINSFDFEITRYVNFKFVEQNLKFGGIRIEDNILIYNNKVYNITKILDHHDF